MAKPHGTYAKIHESIMDHPKTLALAKSLAPVLGLSADMSAPFVVSGVTNLACWCMRESDSGEIGHLTDGKFADVIGLPREISDVKAVAEAWRASGFLDVDGSSVKLHEFEHYAGSLLRDRDRKRVRRSTGIGSNPSEDSPRTVRGLARARSESGIRNTEYGR